MAARAFGCLDDEHREAGAEYDEAVAEHHKAAERYELAKRTLAGVASRLEAARSALTDAALELSPSRLPSRIQEPAKPALFGQGFSGIEAAVEEMRARNLEADITLLGQVEKKLRRHLLRHRNRAQEEAP